MFKSVKIGCSNTYPLMLLRGVNVGVRSVSILREYLSSVYVSYMTDVSFMANVCAGLWMALMAASRFSQMHIARHSRRSFSIPYQYCDHKQLELEALGLSQSKCWELITHQIHLKSTFEKPIRAQLVSYTNYPSTSTWVPHSCLL